jgi:hypothetical protein
LFFVNNLFATFSFSSKSHRKAAFCSAVLSVCDKIHPFSAVSYRFLDLELTFKKHNAKITHTFFRPFSAFWSPKALYLPRLSDAGKASDRRFFSEPRRLHSASRDLGKQFMRRFYNGH